MARRPYEHAVTEHGAIGSHWRQSGAIGPLVPLS